MFYTRHFAHEDTLSRARGWLIRVGFAPDRIKVSTRGVARLTFSGSSAEIDEARLLINAAERSDPEGRPSFWQVARLLRPDTVARAEPEPSLPPPTAPRPHTAAIRWQTADPHDTDPDVSDVRELMDRWQ